MKKRVLGKAVIYLFTIAAVLLHPATAHAEELSEEKHAEISVSANVPALPTESDKEDKESIQVTTGYYINDTYKSVFTEEDIRDMIARREPVVRGTGEIPYFDNYDAVFEYVRDKMIARSEEFAFTVPRSIHLMQVGEYLRDIHSVAIERSKDERYSVSCKDGDYLRANYIGTEWIDAESYDYVNNTVTYTIRNIYTSTAAEEAQVDAAIPGVLSSLGLEGKSEYEKIKAIHDYIVEHVEYDYAALDSYYETGKTDPSVHSTYAALIKGKSVCQGYASLFNRLCEEAGISCRYTGGYSFGVPHAWNVVKLGDLWYNVDVTFDDLETSISYENFLRSEEAFSDRIGGLTEEDKATHPMSQTDYPMPEKEPDYAVKTFVKRLYIVALGREADNAGLEFWVNELVSGRRDGANVAKGFIQSAEMERRKLSNEQYVDVLYKTFFDRAGDASGKAFWNRLLSNGVSRSYVLKGFCHSGEFNKLCGDHGINRGTMHLSENRDQNADITMYVYRCYERALGRKPDKAGLNFWTGQILQKKRTPFQVAAGFIFSKEFINKKLSDEEYVKVMYRMFFDREYDDKGFDFWITELKTGNRSRYRVFEGFANSAEFGKVLESFNL